MASSQEVSPLRSSKRGPNQELENLTEAIATVAISKQVSKRGHDTVGATPASTLRPKAVRKLDEFDEEEKENYGNESDEDGVTPSRLDRISELREELTCSICLEICTRPCTTPCGHSFCRSCLRQSLQHNYKCPKCRDTLPSGFPLKINTALWNTIQLLFPKDMSKLPATPPETLCQVTSRPRSRPPPANPFRPGMLMLGGLGRPRFPSRASPFAEPDHQSTSHLPELDSSQPGTRVSGAHSLPPSWQPVSADASARLPFVPPRFNAAEASSNLTSSQPSRLQQLLDQINRPPQSNSGNPLHNSQPGPSHQPSSQSDSQHDPLSLNPFIRGLRPINIRPRSNSSSGAAAHSNMTSSQQLMLRSRSARRASRSKHDTGSSPQAVIPDPALSSQPRIVDSSTAALSSGVRLSYGVGTTEGGHSTATAQHLPEANTDLPSPDANSPSVTPVHDLSSSELFLPALLMSPGNLARPCSIVLEEYRQGQHASDTLDDQQEGRLGRQPVMAADDTATPVRDQTSPPLLSHHRLRRLTRHGSDGDIAPGQSFAGLHLDLHDGMGGLTDVEASLDGTCVETPTVSYATPEGRTRSTACPMSISTTAERRLLRTHPLVLDSDDSDFESPACPAPRSVRRASQHNLIGGTETLEGLAGQGVPGIDLFLANLLLDAPPAQALTSCPRNIPSAARSAGHWELAVATTSAGHGHANMAVDGSATGGSLLDPDEGAFELGWASQESACHAEQAGLAHLPVAAPPLREQLAPPAQQHQQAHVALPSVAETASVRGRSGRLKLPTAPPIQRTGSSCLPSGSVSSPIVLMSDDDDAGLTQANTLACARASHPSDAMQGNGDEPPRSGAARGNMPGRIIGRVVSGLRRPKPRSAA